MVRDPGGDDLADRPGLVAVPVRRDPDRILCGLLAGCSDHDAHFVEIRLVEACVSQTPLVHDARFGGDVLVDGGAGLGGGEFRIMVASVIDGPDLHVVGFLVGEPGVPLSGMPCESGGIETGGQRESGRIRRIRLVLRVLARVAEVFPADVHEQGIPRAQHTHVGVVESSVDDMVGQVRVRSGRGCDLWLPDCGVHGGRRAGAGRQ